MRELPPSRPLTVRAARAALALLLMPCLGVLAACAGDERVNSSEWVTFAADLAGDGTVDLHLTDVQGKVSRRISGPVVPGSQVSGFGWREDRSLLWFVADREVDGFYELYLAHPDDVFDVPVNLSGPGPDGAVGSVYGPDTSMHSPAWSPDGTKIAYLATLPPGGHALYVVGVTAFPPAPKRVSPFPVAGGAVQSFAWSPTGDRLAFLGDPVQDEQRQLFTVKPDGSDLEQVSVPGVGVTTDDVLGWAWAPDGSRLAFVHDPAGGQLARLWTCLPDGQDLAERSALPAGRRVTSIAWSPTSAHVAYVADQDALDVYELYVAFPAGGAPFKLAGADGPSEVGLWLSWSPEGQRLVHFVFDAQANTGKLRLSHLAGGPPAVLDESPSDGDSPSPLALWSPDGTQIAYEFTWNLPFSVELRVVSASGGAPQVLGPAGPDEYLGSYKWSPDGSKIAYVRHTAQVGGNLHVVPSAGGGSVQVSDVPPSMNQVSGVYEFHWTGDSARVVYTAGDGASPLNPAPLRLWVAVPFSFTPDPLDLTPEPLGIGQVWDFGL